MCNSRMNHVTPFVRTMPVRRSRRTPNNISGIQLDGLASSVAYPAGSSADSEQLTMLVRVPVSPSTGRKHDVHDRQAFLLEDWVSPDVAGEGGAEFYTPSTFGTGVSDDGHRHD